MPAAGECSLDNPDARGPGTSLPHGKLAASKLSYVRGNALDTPISLSRLNSERICRWLE